jgi:hypothetical protein
MVPGGGGKVVAEMRNGVLGKGCQLTDAWILASFTVYMSLSPFKP